MIDPRDFLKTLFQTFDKSALDDFREFIANNSQVKKWNIAADYCLHDKDRPNNTFAFTIIPYDAHLAELKTEIKGVLPKDLKKTKSIQDVGLKFLSHSRRFHFAFVFQGYPSVFNNGTDASKLDIARESLTQTISQMVNMGRSDENVRKLKMLRQNAQAKSFNVALLADTYILSYLYCFVTLVLARETSIEIVGWFSDRDKMTEWCEGVLWDISSESLHGLSGHFGIAIPSDMPIVAIPTKTVVGIGLENLDGHSERVGISIPSDTAPIVRRTEEAVENAMWFDELIRLPDYIAGIFAAWNFDTNQIPGESEKFLQLAENFVADAKNIAVLKIRYDNGCQCSRIAFSSKSFADN